MTTQEEIKERLSDTETDKTLDEMATYLQDLYQRLEQSQQMVAGLQHRIQNAEESYVRVKEEGVQN